MRKKKTLKDPHLHKNTRSISFDRSIRLQLNSLLKFPHQTIPARTRTPKRSPYHYLGKSTTITSLNSCQNSQLLSKKTLNQRHGKSSMSIKKSKPDKKLVPTQKNKLNQYHLKKPKTKQPRKSGKIKAKKFEFSKIHEESRWRRALKKNFMFSNPQKLNHVSKLQDISQIRDIMKDNDTQSYSLTKSFLKNALKADDRKGNVLFNKNRIIIVDWMYLIGASLSLNRETVHLAVHYLDTYLDYIKQYDQLNIAAAASMWLAVKQEQQEHRASILEIMCLSEKIQLQKQQIIEMQRKILISLNFKIKANTLPFWIDFFSLKWDKFVEKCQQESKLKDVWPLVPHLFSVRSASGECYKYYRQLIELGDITVLLGNYQQYQKSKLALACLYLVLRIQLQKQYAQKNQKLIDFDMFSIYHDQFMKKQTPIFRDPLRVNQLFNYYLTELCEYELTEVIPSIKFVSQFLNVPFMYQIDQKTFDQSQSYEQFIRKMTYSHQMKVYSLRQI